MIWSLLYISQWSYFRQLISQTALYPNLGIIFIIFVQTEQFDWTKKTKNQKCSGGIKNWVETNLLRECADIKPYRIFWTIQIKLSPRYMPKSTAFRNEVYCKPFTACGFWQCQSQSLKVIPESRTLSSDIMCYIFSVNAWFKLDYIKSSTFIDLISRKINRFAQLSIDVSTF